LNSNGSRKINNSKDDAITYKHPNTCLSQKDIFANHNHLEERKSLLEDDANLNLDEEEEFKFGTQNGEVVDQSLESGSG
jgi:hypothetical protein